MPHYNNYYYVAAPEFAIVGRIGDKKYSFGIPGECCSWRMVFYFRLSHETLCRLCCSSLFCLLTINEVHVALQISVDVVLGDFLKILAKLMQ